MRSGKGCPGTGRLVPQLNGLGTPYLGNASFANVVSRGLPNSTAILFYGIAPSELQLGNGCTLPNNVNPSSSPTGILSRPPQAGLREPYDGRLSRTVLRAPEALPGVHAD